MTAPIDKVPEEGNCGRVYAPGVWGDEQRTYDTL